MNSQASGRFFKKKLRKKLLFVWARILETRHGRVVRSTHSRDGGHPRLSCLHLANLDDPATKPSLMAHP
jgi:hypothetical protein